MKRIGDCVHDLVSSVGLYNSSDYHSKEAVTLYHLNSVYRLLRCRAVVVMYAGDTYSLYTIRKNTDFSHVAAWRAQIMLKNAHSDCTTCRVHTGSYEREREREREREPYWETHLHNNSLVDLRYTWIFLQPAYSKLTYDTHSLLLHSDKCSVGFEIMSTN